MKPVILITAAAFVVFFGWQQNKLHTLRNTETLPTENVVVADTREPVAEENTEAKNVKRGVSDDEFVQFTKSIERLKKYRQFVSDVQVNEAEKAMREIIPTIERLSGEQLHSAVRLWTGGGRYINFVRVASLVNPEAVLEMFFNHPINPEETKEAAQYITKAFETLFYKDPDAVSRIAESENIPEAFRAGCAAWRAAVIALREPSAENIRAFLLQRKSNRNVGLTLLNRIPTQEGRIVYFRQLSELSKGVFDEANVVIKPLTERMTFTQLAHLADSVPAMKPSGKMRDNMPQPLDLRQTVASLSRDASVEARWQWLVKAGATGQPDDSVVELLFSKSAEPTATTPLHAIIKAWCSDDFEQTATWARNLPPGRVRTSAFEAMRNIVIKSKRPDLASEWNSL